MPHSLRRLLALSILGAVMAAIAADTPPSGARAPFQATRTFTLGGPGGWDYLAADPAGGLHAGL